MEPKHMKFAVGLILGLIVVVHGKALANPGFDGLSASQQTKFRRSPNLVVQSQGCGGGTGDGVNGGMSSTSLQFNNGNNDPNSGLSVQSNAAGVGNGNGGGGVSSTSLQFNNGSPNDLSNPGNNGLSVQSTASGIGGGNGSGGTSSTGLQFNSGGNNPNNGLSVQSHAAGVGDGNGGGGMSSTSLQFNNGNPCDDSNPNNNGLNVQSTASGIGGGNGSGGTSTTGLQFNSGGNNPNGGLSVQSHAAGVGDGNGGGGMSSTSLQFNNGNPCDDSNPNNNGLNVQSTASGIGGGNGSGGTSTTGLQFNSGGNNPNSGLSVQSHAAGVGDGNGGGGMSSTSLQFNNGNPCDDSNPNNNGLNVQSTASGIGGGNGSGGTSTTGLQFNSGGNNPNSGLSVQSHAAGVGDGNGGGGMSSTSLQFNNGGPCDGSNPSNGGLSVQNNAVGVGGGDNGVGASQTTLQTADNAPVTPNQDTGKVITPSPVIPDQKTDDVSNNAVGATHTSLDTNNIDNTLKVDNTAIGATNGENGVGLASTQVHEKDNNQTVDVNNTALGTGDNAGAVSNTSVQEKDIDGKTTKVDTTSLGYGAGSDAVGASKTTVNVDKNDTPVDTPVPTVQHDDNSMQVQSSGIGATNQNGAVGLSTNNVHIKDADEGDINLKTLSAASSGNGGSGLSSVGVNMADGKDTTQNNDLQIKSTNTAVGSSDQGVGGSVSTVQVDDKKNERSLEAQTVGLGFNNENSSGTLTADSMKYHDVDQENHQVVNPDNGSIFQSSKHETNDISSQNVASQYNTVDNDGSSSTTTHSTTTQTKQTQIMQQSYTEQQMINQQNQGYILNQQDQQIDQNQSTLLAQQSQNNVQTQQSQNLLTSQQSQNVVQNQDSTLAQQQTTAQMTSSQQTQSVEQSQSSYLGSHQINIPHGHQASPLLCPDNNQGPGVVCHYEVASVFEYDNNYVLRPSQIITEYCDVLVVSYAVLDVEKFQIGAFSQDEERIFSEIARLKNDNLKIILQLQYVAFYEQYITILNCEDNLNRFTSSVINYLRKWNFDGIELPIMVPESNDKFYETSPIVKEKFPILIEKLRSNLGNDQIISVCLPIEPDYIDFAYDIPKILKYVDWFSVITLDYNVPDEGILQHTRPLTQQTSSDPYCIDFTVNYLLSDLHVPSDKLIINLALYGSSFVLENYKSSGYGARVSGKGPKAPSSNVDGFLTISELCSLTKLNWLNSPAIVTDYDDVPSLVLKVTYARSKCLGGVGIHSISMDDPEGELCCRGVMPFTRVIAMTYDPTRKVFDKDDNLQVVNYIDKSTTNKYDV